MRFWKYIKEEFQNLQDDLSDMNDVNQSEEQSLDSNSLENTEKEESLDVNETNQSEEQNSEIDEKEDSRIEQASETKTNDLSIPQLTKQEKVNSSSQNDLDNISADLNDYVTKNDMDDFLLDRHDIIPDNYKMSESNPSQSMTEQSILNQGDSDKDLEKDSSNEIDNDLSERDIYSYLSDLEINNLEQLTNEEQKEILQELKKQIQELVQEKNQDIEKLEEEPNELSEETNQFLKNLGELPSFKDREVSPGYAIDTESNTDVPESLIRTLINKFLNQRFCKNETDLNIRTNSLEKSDGFYKWEVKDIIVHLKTNQVTKVLNDKYGYEYSNGKNENIPLSFYFDMSGSMDKYTNMLAVIAIELLKKNVKVLIGYNKRANVQIDSIEGNITVSELAKILKSAGYYSSRCRYLKDSRVKSKYIEEDIDDYLIEKKAEKCVIFSDFDPRYSVINLSNKAKVYWFCFESNFERNDILDFNGFIYKVQSLGDLERGLLKVNQKRFETLCYVDNPEKLRKKVRVRK